MPLLKYLFFITLNINAELFGEKLIQDQQFWHRPQLQERMLSERYVPVVVNVEPLKPDKEKWIFKGAGIVNSEYVASYKFAQKFEKLQKIKDHFKRVEFKDGTLSLVVQLMGYEKMVKVKISLEEKDSIRRIHWKIIDGMFVGLVGFVQFKDVTVQDRDKGQHKTEISMTGEGQFDKTLMPSWLATTGLEVVIQHVAIQLRKILETESHV